MGMRFPTSIALILVLTQTALADEKARAGVASVNGESISAAEVDQELRRAYGEQDIASAERKQLERAALEQVINRRLVLGYLTKTGQAASKQDVDLEFAQLEKELKAQEITLAQHCEKVGQTVADVRRALTWKLSWQRYLERQMTEANLEKYFKKYHREFDDTQLRVAQILFKLREDAGEADVVATRERADRLRQDIAAGKMSFAAAAKQHSQAPSAANGGDIGWIERHKPMPEDFSRVAYTLRPGEVSDPLVSSFGIHLITVLEEKPGAKTWRDAEAELRPAVAVYLFRWIGDQERAAAKIEYSDSYINPKR
jgi:peptidyl-prolyl cis-trans isomerase SurA